MAVQMLLAVAERAYAFYQSAEAKQVIEEIWKALRTVYTDIAHAHFVSAQSALASAAHSNNPDAEVRAAIAHLRDAFHVYQALLRQTRTERFLLFWSDEVPVLEWDQQRTVKAALFEVATCIALYYADLHEITNGRAWKVNALTYLDDYCAAVTAHLTPEYLRSKVSDSLVDFRQVQVITSATMSHIGTRDEIRYSINPAGEQYIREQKDLIKTEAMKIFDTRGL